MILLFRVLACAMVGFLLNIICQRTIPTILAKRNRTITIGETEKKVLLLVMTLAGGYIGYKITSTGLLIYILILLGISEMIAVIDWHERIIPNELWQSVIILKIIFSIPTFFGITGFPTLNIIDSILGFVICFIIFLSPTLIKKCVGAGDVKLAAAIGFGLGLYGALFAIVIMGALILVYSTAQREMPVLKVMESMIPMGPFIVSGMMGVLLLGTII